MLFAEEMNNYFGGPTFPNPSGSAGGGGAPMEMVWKGGPGAHNAASPAMNDFSAYMGSDSSKLMTKWGHPMDYGKMGQGEPGGGGGPASFTPGLYSGGGSTNWNEPAAFQFQPQQQQQQDHAAMAHAENKFSQLNLKANPFQPSLHQHQQTPSGLFTPPVDLVNGQWGRAEINQTTPWNMEMNGATDPGQQQPTHPRYGGRKWEQQRGDEGAFGGGGYAGPMNAGYGMHMYGGERMMAGAMPQFGAAGGRGPPAMSNRGWDPSGANKFAPEMPGAGGSASHRNAPSGLFSGPPPPLHSMNMMPPRPMLGHMPPPPLLPTLNPHGMGGFTGNMVCARGNSASQMADFKGSFIPNGAVPSAGLSDDSVWQDPNGELRKWQRDTGTSIWGDPAKQASVPIQRWQQFTADEVAAKSNLLAKEGGEVVESGWGELPPIGASASSANSNSTSNGSGNGVAMNSGGQYGGGQAAMGQQHKGPRAGNGGGWGGATAAAEAGVTGRGATWNGQNEPAQQQGGGAWSEHAQAPQQPQSQFHVPQQGGAGNGAGNFVLPPSTAAAQPPSLLAMIDSGTPDVEQRKATSPNGSMHHQQQQQALKVSLAEELSSLSHGMGSGIW